MRSDAGTAGVPRSPKDWLGYAASCWVNARLRAAPDRARIGAWIATVNQRPRLFASVDTEIRVPTDFGFSLWCDRRSGIGQTLIEQGAWEGLLSRTLPACLRPGDVAIDIGANIGYDTLLMSGAVGAQGIVHAFEPEPRNLALLLRNVASAPHRNVVLHSSALGDTAGIARITPADVYYSGRPNLRPHDSATSQPVSAGRLDAVLALAHDQRIAVVKMDIEGYEFKAIQGMGRLLDRVDVLTCEINHGFLHQCGSSAGEIFGFMQAHGFRSWCAEPVSDGRWVAAGADYRIATTGGEHFDALFCRQLPAALQPLVA